VIPRKPAGITEVNVIFFFTGSARISDVARTFERHEAEELPPQEGEITRIENPERRLPRRRFDAREMNSRSRSLERISHCRAYGKFVTES